MQERDYGYVAATFAQKDVEPFQRFAEEICKESDLYNSETVSYIRGNVSSDLHLTIYYGLVDDNIDKDQLEAKINNIQISKLKLGGLFLKQAFDNRYQILWIVVKDDDGYLLELANEFQCIEHEGSVQLEFMPHLTLAYVKPEYTIPKLVPEYPRVIKVEKIKYFQK